MNVPLVGFHILAERKICQFFSRQSRKVYVSSRGRLSPPCASVTRETVQKYTYIKTMPQVSRSHCELRSVIAELLWRRREVVTVVSSDVGTDAAALAPPLVAVSSQTGETIDKHPLNFDLSTFFHIPVLCTAFRGLPGLDVLRHDAPRQVVVTVITPRVVEEIRPRGEDVTRKPRTTLQDTQTRQKISQ